MDKSKIEAVVKEAVKIYFDQNCSVKEAIEKAREIYEGAKA